MEPESDANGIQNPNCLYLGSFPVTLANPNDRARYIAQQLENILKNRQTNGTPVIVKMALCGIQVTSPDLKDTYMIHALRRVSFSTCLSDLFAFAARDPGKPLDKQFCHVFRTNQAETLNSEIGSAFSSAYTLQRSRDDMSCASGRDSRASIRSVQTNSGRPDSSMSMRSVQSRAESRAEYPRADHTRIHSDSRPVSRTAGAAETHRYIYDYDHDYGRNRKTSTDSDEVQNSQNSGNNGNVTVRSKLSNKSDDSAISSLADDLERRVMLEIERQVKDQNPRNSRKNSENCENRDPAGRRKFSFPSRETKESRDRKHSSNTHSHRSPAHSVSSNRSTSGYSRLNSGGEIQSLTESRESSGYSSIGSVSDSVFQKIKNNYKTNPVAKKLKVLAPGDHYSDLDSRLKTADWYHKGLPKEVGISVLGASNPGTFLVLASTLLLRGVEHVHEYQIVKESKIGWYLKGSSRAFPHLLMLVAHYQSHLDILPMSLTSAPVPT